MSRLHALLLSALLGLSGCALDKPDVDDDGDGYPPDVDCDDAHAEVHPDAPEVCDGLDNDCDGRVNANPSDGVTVYADSDGDGFGAGEMVSACDVPAGFTAGDGDCDDTRADVNPDAVELCDGADDDCDGTVDVDARDALTWYADTDGDNYGDPDVPTEACSATEGTVGDDTDCDDAGAGISPGATEICNDIDDNCDGLVDDADPSLDLGSAAEFYPDDDGDGYGDANDHALSCLPPYGYVADYSDCNDRDADIHPDADEICNHLTDDDCDGLRDEDDPGIDPASETLWYGDSDGDGYGSPDAAHLGCRSTGGSVSTGTDCDDAAAAVNPGADEVCDTIDNDCDGATDDADSSVEPSTMSAWYPDADADTYGNPSGGSEACAAPAGYVSDATDCDDTDASEHVGATYYVDADDDGYGDDVTTVYACSLPDGCVENGDDCDDSDASVGTEGAGTVLISSASELRFDYDWDTSSNGTGDWWLQTDGTFDVSSYGSYGGTWGWSSCTSTLVVTYDNGTEYTGTTTDEVNFSGTMVSFTGFTGTWSGHL